MSLVPLGDSSHGNGRLTAYIPSTTLKKKEERELQHEADLVERRMEHVDRLERKEHRLRIDRLDQEARDRAFYVGNRMNESAAMAHRVINEPSEPIRASLATWHDVCQEVEQYIFRRNFT